MPDLKDKKRRDAGEDPIQPEPPKAEEEKQEVTEEEDTGTVEEDSLPEGTQPLSDEIAGGRPASPGFMTVERGNADVVMCALLNEINMKLLKLLVIVSQRLPEKEEE